MAPVRQSPSFTRQQGRRFGSVVTAGLTDFQLAANQGVAYGYGYSDAYAVGSFLSASTGAAAGVTTVSQATGAFIGSSKGDAAGIGASSLVGTGIVAANTSTAAGIGATSCAGTGIVSANTSISAGIGATSCVGTGIKPATTSTAAGVGASNVIGFSYGIAIANAPGVGASSCVGTGINRANISTATGIGEATGDGSTALTILSGAGAAVGTGASSCVGLSITSATTSTAAGVGASSCVGTGIKLATTSTAAGIGAANAACTGFNASTAAASGVGAAPAVGAVVNFLRPDSDTVLDGWTDQAGGTTSIFQSLDELTVNDTDYVKSPSNVGSTADLLVRLFDGSTQIVQWTHSNISASFTTTEQTLTGPQFAAITNFSNLSIELDDNQGNVYRFPISNPALGVAEPVKVRYRYKKLAA